MALSDYYAIYQKYLSRGELRLQFCLSCQRYIFYPRSLCPYCWEEQLEWKPSSGRGTIYSYTVVNVSALPDFSAKTPYIYAIIELEEGVRIPANIIDGKPDKLKVGMPVKLYIQERTGQKVAAFKPI